MPIVITIVYIYIYIHFSIILLNIFVIAELAGFNDTIPPFAGAPPAQANIGLNYASGGGGIREETSQNLVTT